MSGQEEYKYDVAFSFLQEDEGVARQLNDLLSPRLRTFAYFDRQEELAGTDGEKTFNCVFGKDARIVAVLYRARWGQTPWTRIEETAIRNRSYNKGYDFVLMIPMDTPPCTPEWLPKTRIWIGLDRWGIAGAAAAIEARVQEAGGMPHEETPLEQAQRIARQKKAEEKRQAFLGSESGVNQANKEVEFLYAAIEKAAAEINEAGGDIQLSCKRALPKALNLHAWDLMAYTTWDNKFANTLHQSELLIRTLKRMPSDIRHEAPPRTLSAEQLYFDAPTPGIYGWVSKSNNRFFTSQDLAEYCVKLFLDRLQTEKPWQYTR